MVFLFLSSTAHAVVVGPPTQLSMGPNDAVNPAISGDWIVWTTDTGQPNGLDIFAVNRKSPPPVDITPFPGGQFFDDVDGHYAVYIDDSGPSVTVMLKDLASPNAAVSMNIDAIGGSRPAVSNPGGGVAVSVVYVRQNNESDIVFVEDPFTSFVLTNSKDVVDAPTISGDYIVWQGQPPNDNFRHLYEYRISTGAITQLTSGANDDTNPDVNGNTIVFTRGGKAIMALPVGGGNPIQLSAPNLPGTRDRAHVSGNNVVWDDHRNGVDCDVYWSAATGGGETMIIGGPGDQFLTDIDGTNVVYTDGPANGVHNVFLVQLFGCLADTDCTIGQQCDLQSHSCIAKPQCKTTADCAGGLVCSAGACVPCANNGQCGNNQVCQMGRCGAPQCVNNGGCGGGKVCVNNACVPCTSDAQCSNNFHCDAGACVPGLQPKPDPDGCGNGTAIQTVHLQNLWKVPVAAADAYLAKPNKKYWVCIVNGDGNPAQRTSHFLFFHDFDNVLTPADFKPNNNPPSVVMKPLTPWKFSPLNFWFASLFGPNPPEAVKIKIMESN